MSPEPKTQEPEAWIHIGSIARPHGIKGALRVHLFNAQSELLQEGLNVQLRRRGNAPIQKKFETKVLSVIGDNRVFFDCVKDRTEAETFREYEVFVRRDDLPEVDEDEVYLSDLIDARVENTQGELLGKAIAFSDNSAQVLIDVETPDDAIVTLPFVPPIIQSASAEEKLIVLDPPLGFFEDEELQVRKRKRVRRSRPKKGAPKVIIEDAGATEEPK